jgi:hypothetical protein
MPKTISFSRSQVSRVSFSPQSTPIAKPCVSKVKKEKRKKKKEKEKEKRKGFVIR